LWGEATKVGDQLFWCEGNATLRVPVKVVGNTSEPFFLVATTNSKDPDNFTLNAIPTTNECRIEKIYCLHPKELKKRCDSGNVTLALSPLEKFMKTYKVTFN